MSKHLVAALILSSGVRGLLAQAPPAAKLDPSRVTPYHHAFRMVLANKGVEEDVGTLDDFVIIRQDSGRPAIIRIQNVDGPTGVMTDSAIADSSTLAPRRHNSMAERRQLQLQFGPKRVTGSFFEPGDPAIPIDQAIAEGVYDSNMLDVLITAMPLAPGYTGRIMVYLYEAGGPVPLDVAVTGSEMIGGADNWVANVALNGHTVRYYVGKADHQVTRIISTPAPGVEIRLVR